MAFTLYDLIERKNKSTVFKSVFCHPEDSTVSVENNGGDRYEKLHITPSGFEKASTMIMYEVAKHYNDIEKSGLGYIEVTFYSTHSGHHITRGVHKDKHGKIIFI